jgi:hypothetical protein
MQVGVALEREGQVGAIGRRRRLVRQQLVLGGERQRAQIVERPDSRAREPRALERVGLLYPLGELVERRELRVLSRPVDQRDCRASRGTARRLTRAGLEASRLPPARQPVRRCLVRRGPSPTSSRIAPRSPPALRRLASGEMQPFPEAPAPAADIPAPVCCDHCGRPVGVYEPMIMAQRGRVRETSRAVEPPRRSLADAGTTYYHRACYSTL